MAQFGAGSQLAAQCPVVPTPDGWRTWTDADGPVPDALAQRAKAIASDPGVPLGATESYPLPGVTTLIRIEPRAWGRDEKGDLVQGCFRTAGIYLPAGSTEIVQQKSGLDRTIGILTVASLTIGAAATLAHWSQR